jgi:hypothetical protein
MLGSKVMPVHRKAGGFEAQAELELKKERPAR